MAILSSDQVKMTSLLEKLVGIIAPHRCIVCSNYDNVVCTACMYDMYRFEVPFCVLCGGESLQWRVCAACGAGKALSGVWVHSPYDGVMAELIKRFKFDHARAAYQPLATAIVSTLPHLGTDWVVVAVPTATNHVRQRSFDHTRLVARRVAQLCNVPYVSALQRVQNTRQVGATRAERLQQAQAAVALRPRTRIAGKKVVLIDDVCTTGATLQACAAVLTNAGATEVWGAVAAWQPPK